MNTKRISEIQKNAKKIDCRINLFEGFCPKRTENSSGESLFWRNVVNIYGLLADCDSIQIKREPNLFWLMNKYSFIARDDLDFVKDFWNNISALRKCFCHNTDISLYYQKRNLKKIEKFLDEVFIISTQKPKTIDEIESKHWSLVNADIDRKFDEYLNIMNRGFLKWDKSDDKVMVVDEWIDMVSEALFKDTELVSNIKADLAEYSIRNFRLDTTVKWYISIINGALEKNCFSYQDIKTFIKGLKNSMSNREILLEVIKQKS
ncbi:hypothetical protein HMPREF9970_0510 [Lachnoanaerobaculum saburreum F0468]|jgi:hypothetical protein|uniref:Uncharacterized protein n=1 Tax=Lachnoanaerobaculum saburreum F0468 TaxID=1095750 RepID=I0R6J8_9FIRM|nr:hypothetical protein [Lachnoanaerobaculum saburreum]EIC95306.1 hypothetical protein HMPREF9970_0510 [Lachnoanaerobaculum saburreum F0468]